MNTVRRILVVVDNLVEFKEVTHFFDQLPPEWRVHYSQNTKDALGYLDQVPFDIIFADLSAGPFACAQFLAEVWVRYPNIIRFLLGSKMDPDLMVACVMGGHQFMHKPLTPEGVHAALERAEFMNRLLQDKHIQTVVSLIRTFPTRPKIYVEVMKELRSPGASPHTIGELVSRDLAISTKLLQLINSASFGLTQQVTSPADAVLLLGMQTTASLVLGIEAFAALDHVKPLYFAIDHVWRHSQAVAYAARQIAEIVTYDSEIAHEAFTAGLLHDIGKLALAMNLEEPYQRALKMARENNVPAADMERQILGATHAEAGAYLLSLWGIDGRIIEAVAGHHQPADQLGSNFTALTAVHIANTLENSKHFLGGDFFDAPLELNYPPELGLEKHMEAFREVAAFAFGSDNHLV